MILNRIKDEHIRESLAVMEVDGKTREDRLKMAWTRRVKRITVINDS